MSVKQNTAVGKSAKLSLIGDRKINQDRCILLTQDESTLISLADGMGGHPRGESAAQIFIDTCRHYLKVSPQPTPDPATFLTLMMQKAHESILSFGYDQTPAIDPRTTAVAALIQNNKVYWAHAGDSRCYLIRDQQVAYRTIDHSYVEHLRKQGIISAAQQEKHPQRNYVTRCLGGNTVPPDITLGKAVLKVGDILLLCSDGLWGKISDEMICEVLFNKQPLSEAVRFLAEEATGKGFPESDNVTLLAVQIEEGQNRAASGKTGKGGSKKPEDLADAIAELQQAINSFESENK